MVVVVIVASSSFDAMRRLTTKAITDDMGKLARTPNSPACLPNSWPKPLRSAQRQKEPNVYQVDVEMVSPHRPQQNENTRLTDTFLAHTYS